jgi:hypothetical protein
MSAHPITWSHGRAEVLTTAAMLSHCEFVLEDREFSPFARAPWPAGDVPELPGHLRVLGAEFVCLPFGEGGPTTRTADGWESIGSAPPNSPGHGLPADAEWEVIDEREGGVSLRLLYPNEHDIVWLERHIDGIPGVPGLAFSLKGKARRPLRTSVGVHPILRLPAMPQSLEIATRFSFGMTYPADLVIGRTRAARGGLFSDLTAVPLSADRFPGQTEDFSRLPFSEPTEDVVQLCGVSEPILIRYVEEGMSVTIDWDRKLLPSAQLWISDRALTDVPWNGIYRGLGVELIASAFDLADDVSTHDNPISQRGVPTSIDMSPSRPLSVAYRIVASLA